MGTGQNYGLSQPIETGLKLLETHEEIIISGLGSAIWKAISCAEIIKRRIYGLHQYIRVFTLERRGGYNDRGGRGGYNDRGGYRGRGGYNDRGGFRGRDIENKE